MSHTTYSLTEQTLNNTDIPLVFSTASLSNTVFQCILNLVWATCSSGEKLLNHARCFRFMPFKKSSAVVFWMNTMRLYKSYCFGSLSHADQMSCCLSGGAYCMLGSRSQEGNWWAYSGSLPLGWCLLDQDVTLTWLTDCCPAQGRQCIVLQKYLPKSQQIFFFFKFLTYICSQLFSSALYSKLITQV